MKNKGLLTFLFAMLASGMVALPFMSACAQAASPASSPPPTPIKLKYHTQSPATHDGSIQNKWWMDEVTKRSKGRVVFESFYSESLAKAKDQPSSLKAGLFNVGAVYHGMHPAELPLSQFDQMPWFLTSDIEVLGKAFDEVQALPALKQEMTKMNIHYLYAAQILEGRWLISKKPVYKLADLKGLRVREIGRNAAAYALAGASPSALPATEVFDALQKGTLDAFAGVISSMSAYALHEVAKYFIWLSDGAAHSMVLMNLDTWNKLPADIQGIVTEVSKDFYRYEKEYNARRRGEILEVFKKAGVNFIDFPKDEQAKFLEGGMTVVEKWIAELEAKGLPARTVFNTYRAGQKKYMELLEKSPRR